MTKTIDLKLTLDSETAEEILFALKMRASQVRSDGQGRDESRARMESIRQQLNTQFEQAFKWMNYPERSRFDDEIRVSIRGRKRW